MTTDDKVSMKKSVNLPIIKFALVWVAILLLASPTYAFDKSMYADSSKLANGTWVKIKVSESGIYQITADDLRSWGLSGDVSSAHVFGYGGALKESLTADYGDDLPQLPVVREDNRLLFYAQGPITWRQLNSSLPQLQVQNPYSTDAYYFVTEDSRYQDIAITTATNSPIGSSITTFTERLYHEQDLINPGKTGRNFMGEDFSTNKSQTFKFSLDGLVSGSTVKVYTNFGAKTLGAKSKLSFQYNGTELPASTSDNIDVAYSAGYCHYTVGKSLKSFVLEGTTDLSYTITFSTSGTLYFARLDYITVNYERTLALTNGQLCFGLNQADASSNYQVANCGSNTHIWDVTTPWHPIAMVTTGNEKVSFTPSQDGRREFVAFDGSGNYSHPTLSEKVDNQNIHGEPIPDMIILAPSEYLTQAQRVATMHEEVDSFRVLVLDHTKVFNEFSSGAPDAMAYRRLCKMFYDRGTSEDGHHLGYLLLFGNGHYDNRLIGDQASALSYPSLLSWQSEVSSNEDNSFTSDDIFAQLADDASSIVTDKLTIGVGRFPVRSVSQARTVADKLINYVQTPAYGSWKNQVLNVADDEDQAIHMSQAEAVIATARENGGEDMVFNHVFIDAYNAVSQGGSRSYPEARNKMYNTLSEGVLWWNYTGHSSTTGWTGEGLLRRVDVEQQLYYKHLPVLYTASCEFLRNDGTDVSSGEVMFLNSNGGVIAIIGSPRLVYVSSNGPLNASVAKYMFSRDSEGKQRRLGDIIRLGKNDIYNTTDNNARYVIFGDPAMRLAYAPYTIKIETINGKAVDEDDMPIFQARETIEFSGKIVNLKGEVANDFNGSVISTLYDCEQSVTTNGYGEGAPFTYEERSNRLAINVNEVENGRFSIKVIIPTEVNNIYDNFRPALINLYAYDSNHQLEAKGYNDNFYIYGYDDEQVTDTIGPEIISFGLNSEDFVDGSSVNESPLVLATIADDSGVNFSGSGIGHSISLTLDGTTSYNDVVSYYTPLQASTGTLGSINYALSDLTDGAHTLRLRVWDVYNNVSEKTISFNVVNGLAPEITDVYAAANPASVETNFYVKHNRPDAIMSITIEVYDLMGRLVWNTTQSGRSDMYTSAPITWDLIDNGGRRVPRGIYVYRATISTDGIKEATKAKKLAVTGQ